MSKYTVVMSSPEFGSEEFPRDTIKEVRETKRNLLRKIKALNDGIKREITFRIN